MVKSTRPSLISMTCIHSATPMSRLKRLGSNFVILRKMISVISFTTFLAWLNQHSLLEHLFTKFSMFLSQAMNKMLSVNGELTPLLLRSSRQEITSQFLGTLIHNLMPLMMLFAMLSIVFINGLTSALTILYICTI